jgi:Bifunctional DNA primase/polymerase, N-terminal/Primase C terminal 1 (PriCT-1)
MTTISNLHAAALDLNRKFAIFPCQPKGKFPVTDNGFLGAVINDPDRINGWWSQIPTLNIGLATGAPSGLFVLDVDDEEGESSLRELESQHGALPPTIEAITGKGRHLYFAIGSNGPIKNSIKTIAAGLDIRGDGGYVVCPPSVHPSGRAYEWSVDSANDLAAAPAWLIDLIKVRTGNGEAKGKPLEHWHHVLTNTISTGERNSTLASICGKLLHYGLTDLIFLYDIMLCVNAARCDEPLPKEEIEKIVSSVVRGHLTRKLRR